MAVLPAPFLRLLSLLPVLSLFAAAASAGAPPTASRWLWPLDPAPVVVSRFDPPADAWGAGHRGVDLAAAVGRPVRAPRLGTVSFTGVVAGRPVVVVSHPDGLRSTLEPVLPTSVVGTAVGAGDVVGTIGPVPGHCSPAACLHWGVLRGTTYLDPLSFVAPHRVILLPLSATTALDHSSRGDPARVGVGVDVGVGVEVEVGVEVDVGVGSVGGSGAGRPG